MILLLTQLNRTMMRRRRMMAPMETQRQTVVLAVLLRLTVDSRERRPRERTRRSEIEENQRLLLERS
jgi:hypothetical protein